MNLVKLFWRERLSSVNEILYFFNIFHVHMCALLRWKKTIIYLEEKRETHEWVESFNIQ